MSETRVLPKAGLRSTGIPRTTKAVQRPQVGAGTSNLTASPSAGKGAHDRVREAQRTGGATFMPGAAQPAPGALGAATGRAPQRRATPNAGIPAMIAPTIQTPTTIDAPDFNEQEGALMATLLADFLSDPRVRPEAQQIAHVALDKLAAVMGGKLGRRAAQQQAAQRPEREGATERAAPQNG